MMTKGAMMSLKRCSAWALVGLLALASVSAGQGYDAALSSARPVLAPEGREFPWSSPSSPYAALVAQAGGGPAVVVAAEPFLVSWESDTPFSSYVVTIDGVARTVALPSEAPGGGATFRHTEAAGVSVGAHTVTVAVCIAGGICGPESVPVPFEARLRPARVTPRVERP